jgi:hypothetical protein
VDELWANKYVFKGNVKSNEMVTVIKENNNEMQEITVKVKQKKSNVI